MHLLISNGSRARFLNGTKPAKDIAGFLISNWAAGKFREVNSTCISVSGETVSPMLQCSGNARHSVQKQVKERELEN